MAERVGFEPTCRLPDKPLSRRSRYDHFGTSPQEQVTRQKSHVTSVFIDHWLLTIDHYYRRAAKNCCINALLSAAHTPETIVTR